MKKRILLLPLAAMWVLAGCEEDTIIYEGEEKPVSVVEEIISDKLEVENPELDLDVNITEDTED
ncbi:hypothetical protein [Lysinibacillus sp. 54212]|uniref:hypothetical protein n=1 Tax=Lysinibacillus sp. 54212 TaxID=3119829 RepID=UPI002FC711EE